MQTDNIQNIGKGLFLDTDPKHQPAGTYRFALNTIVNASNKESLSLGNELSNIACSFFPVGYTPLGSVYIGDGQTAVLLVNKDGTGSMIGIFDEVCKFTVHVSDDLSAPKDKLNFNIGHQIDVTYRLRLGCERTIYWVDDLNRPRYFNFDSPENFKNSDGTWNQQRFNLQKTYESIPEFSSLEVLESGGAIEPGSINVAIQYVDESLNPTEWANVSETVKIYNDFTSEDYRKINGSINSEVEFENFPTTGKALKINLRKSTLDKTFLYYRLAIIESNNGSGLVNSVTYTEVIPISKAFFIYTGNNTVSKGTEEEILQFSDIIQRAGSIEQLENILILGNTQGKQVDYCKLQKYASKVKADCVTRTILVNAVTDPSNPKNPSQAINGTGYMPGEIYSFGLVYIFEDGSLSPVFHIPGKSPLVNPSTVFSAGPKTYPMSQDNSSGTSVYDDNSTCSNSNYWGKDSEGVSLTGKFVRHHRFPLRSDIGVPLIEAYKEGDVQTSEFFMLTLYIDGDLKVPYCDFDADPDCVEEELPQFDIRVSYKVDGESFSFTQTIDPDMYSSGESGTYELSISHNSQYHGSNIFTDITFAITNILGNFQPETSIPLNVDTTSSQDDAYFEGEATYKLKAETFSSTVQERLFKSEMYGIKFSGIDLPPETETNGEKIVGYYIVRNERTEFDKTIIDSGVLIPSVVNKDYISHGLLQPETKKLSENVFGLIHAEHKFLGKEYTNYDKLIFQGNYNVKERKYGKINFDDIFDGSSLDTGKQKKGNDDGHAPDNTPYTRGMDGWSLNIISRDNILNYVVKNPVTIASDKIKSRFYLDALGHRSIDDNKKNVYNISTDNKIGMIEFDPTGPLPKDNMPYVVMYKENLDSYSNFRVLPYYKENMNPIYFNSNTGSQVVVYNGDSYITPMRYVNTVFYTNRIAKRKGRTNALKKILGPLLVVIGGLLAFFTGGASLGLVGIGLGLSVAGLGALFIASGLKTDAFNKAYNEEYDKGLRETALDDWVDAFYNYRNNAYSQIFGFGGQAKGKPGSDGPSDDTIQWIGDCATDIFLESSLNMGLRKHFPEDDLPTFLDAPGRIESGNDNPIDCWEYYKILYQSSNDIRYPVSSLEHHLARKLLAFDTERNDNRSYLGVALGEYYSINPDYFRVNKQKIYFHLPLEYNCCSDCKEDFPHRWHWSQQSYQEELSDNYRIFLPNNYKDLEGETGEIMNIFKMSNNLFIHTREALWLAPRSYQERVTDQIVSFIGTGAQFEIPPRKIVDDDTGSSAGTQHKWSRLKTPSGYFFMSENQKKFYVFNGQKLEAVSDVGLQEWFFKNSAVKVDESYYKSNFERYPYSDNPSNPIGSGFITTYDAENNRVILTKKDYILSDLGTGYEMCTNGVNTVVFPDIENTILFYTNQGWVYDGIENCKLKFERQVERTETEIREVEVALPSTADIIIHLDMSGSFNDTTRGQIITAVNTWLSTFSTENPAWEGKLYYIILPDTVSERCWNVLQWIKDGSGLQDRYGTPVSPSVVSKDLVVVSFVNENFKNETTGYHGLLSNPLEDGHTGFYADYGNFVSLYNTHIANGGTFNAFSYPIVFFEDAWSTGFLQHVLAAMKGVPYTNAEISNILVNPFVKPMDWTTMMASLQGPNPYPDSGLENYGWKVRTNRGWDTEGEVITPEQFQEDMEEFLLGVTGTEFIEVEVTYWETEYMYVDGIPAEDLQQADTSWTLSLSLDTGAWTSWHSYLPSMYIRTPSNMFSWDQGNQAIWKHNVEGSYQTFYGQYYPHILEYVSLSNPLITRVWNHIRLFTDAEKFDNDAQDFYDVRYRTFNKAILYNSRQCSGLMDLVVKDTAPNSENYLSQQTVNHNNNSSIIDRTETDWLINDFRDIRIDYEKPIWKQDIFSLQSEYYIDKVLNTPTMDIHKDWTQLESFRDKYLVVRLIFDNFADTKLITNFSAENEQPSLY